MTEFRLSAENNYDLFRKQKARWLSKVSYLQKTSCYMSIWRLVTFGNRKSRLRYFVHAKRWQKLSNMAYDFLTISAYSATSERSFIGGKDLISDA